MRKHLKILMPNLEYKRLPGKQIPRLNKTWRNERTYHYNHFSTPAIDKPSSYPMETVEVLKVKRHITKHYMTLPFKSSTPIEDLPSMFLRPIDTNLQYYRVGKFPGPSQTDERHDPVYVSLLGGNI